MAQVRCPTCGRFMASENPHDDAVQQGAPPRQISLAATPPPCAGVRGYGACGCQSPRGNSARRAERVVYAVWLRRWRIRGRRLHAACCSRSPCAATTERRFWDDFSEITTPQDGCRAAFLAPVCLWTPFALETRSQPRPGAPPPRPRGRVTLPRSGQGRPDPRPWAKTAQTAQARVAILD